MYLSIANHLGLHISEPLYKKLVGPSTCNPRSAGESLYFIYLLISLRQSPHCHCYTLQHANETNYNQGMLSGLAQTMSRERLRKVSMVVLRGAQTVGLDPHLSYLIYIYKSKITKYMYMVHCNKKTVIHHQGH
jgi:hypothetical protein